MTAVTLMNPAGPSRSWATHRPMASPC